MRKYLLAFVAVFFVFAFCSAGVEGKRVDSPSVVRDATQRAKESVMTSSVDDALDPTPIGTVIIWTKDGSFPPGWLECNGQTIGVDAYPEFVSRFGARLPDYRGVFLRGVGGKSAALGVLQDYAVHTNGKNSIDLSGIGINVLEYIDKVDYNPPKIVNNSSYMSYSDYHAAFCIGVSSTVCQPRYSNFIGKNPPCNMSYSDYSAAFCIGASSVVCQPRYSNFINSCQSGSSSDPSVVGSVDTSMSSRDVVVKRPGTDLLDLGVKIESSAGETRPVNKAVKYIIKVE